MLRNGVNGKVERRKRMKKKCDRKTKKRVKK